MENNSKGVYFMQKKYAVLLAALLLVCACAPCAISETFYWNTAGGKYYHVDAKCRIIDPTYYDTMKAVESENLGTGAMANILPCSVCIALEQRAECPGMWVGEAAFASAKLHLDEHLMRTGAAPIDKVLGWNINRAETILRITVQDTDGGFAQYLLELVDGLWTVYTGEESASTNG